MYAILISALSQGFLYAPMAMGVFIAFQILDTPDLTIDGSLVFGMTACAAVTIAGHPILGIAVGLLAGGLAGICTGVLQTKLKINAILSGILTMTGLYTINFTVLGGQPNLYLQSAGETGNVSSVTIYKMFSDFAAAFIPGAADWSANMSVLILTAAIVVVFIVLLAVFFKTRPGMEVRATGDNEEMVRSSSINADAARIRGVMLSNALVGLSGALLCQQQRYADLNCGSSMLVIGLASVIIGAVLFGDRGVTVGIISAAVGSIVYRIILQIAYKVDMPSYAVKLLSAVIVVLALTIPRIRKKQKDLAARRRREREKEAAA